MRKSEVILTSIITITALTHILFRINIDTENYFYQVIHVFGLLTGILFIIAAIIGNRNLSYASCYLGILFYTLNLSIFIVGTAQWLCSLLITDYQFTFGSSYWRSIVDMGKLEKCH